MLICPPNIFLSNTSIYRPSERSSPKLIDRQARVCCHRSFQYLDPFQLLRLPIRDKFSIVLAADLLTLPAQSELSTTRAIASLEISEELQTSTASTISSVWHYPTITTRICTWRVDTKTTSKHNQRVHTEVKNAFRGSNSAKQVCFSTCCHVTFTYVWKEK
jgi:hypothetical protein